VGRARELAHVHDDLVPIDRLREGFEFGGQRISFGSFQKGIHRSRIQQGPAALTLTTSVRDPYADRFDAARRPLQLRRRHEPREQLALRLVERRVGKDRHAGDG
jgi:hypothetical protein